VLLLHGWQSRRPPGHWMRWLAEELTARGHQAVYPQLPEPDEPVLARWLAAAGDAVVSMRGARRVVVGHSLGAVAWLHLAAQRGAGLPVDRVALVAPPGRDFMRRTRELSAFDYDPDRCGPIGARTGRLVHSDKDRYCVERADTVYGKLPGLGCDLLAGQGHLDMDAGYGRWPAILAWCEDERSPIIVRPASSGALITVGR
jgi:uncharacterized protein